VEWLNFNNAGSCGENKATGSITIPEIMHDTQLDEIVFDVTLDKESKENDLIKTVVRKNLVPLIRTLILPLGAAFKDFNRDIIEHNTKDVLIDPSLMNGHPVLQTYKPTAPHKEEVKFDSLLSAPKIIGQLSKINQKVVFEYCSPEQLYDALLDPQKVSVWTHKAPCKIQKGLGLFSLFNSNISGEITSLDPNHQIKMNWRIKTWPINHYAKVVIDIEEGSSGTVLKLVVEDVPVSEVASTESNWKGLK
jgi:activator of HSP90 ATPase